MVHPHGRGDNVRMLSISRWMRGSPPRAWGQCKPYFAPIGEWRFTPTGVGTMHITQVYESVDAVHPHGRGDNGMKQWQKMGRGGSPPRAWGQFVCVIYPAHSNRFTPTGVGTMRGRRCRRRA